MIANLPLIFAGGNPKSLSKMTVQELECFITFLVHCSWGHDTAKHIGQPQWWPAETPFSNPFHGSHNPPKDWASRLKEIIRQCYVYHSSEFLLRFSEELAKNPLESLRYVDNCDRTTSLYQRASGRLLVTFRNENILYDRKADVTGRKCLLPRRQNPSESMVEPLSADIYLCDTCDEVFDNFKCIQEHEKICLRPASFENSPPSPEPVLKPEIEQNGFLRLFNLQAIQSRGSSSLHSKDEAGNDISKSTARPRRSAFGSLSRFPFSSPAGRHVNNGHCLSPEAALWQREHLERYCPGPPLSLECPKWMTKLPFRKFPAKYKKTDNYWTRHYSFVGQKDKLVLDLNSQLLFLKCKPVSVTVDTLTPAEIEDVLRRSRDAAAARKAAAAAVDNDIEFVSVTLCPSSVRQKMISKRRSLDIRLVTPKKKTKCRKIEFVSTNNVNRVEPFKDNNIIDLCSEDDDESELSENTVPFPVACHSSGEASRSLSVAATPQSQQPLELDSEQEAARYNSLNNTRSHCYNLTNFLGFISDPIK